MFQGYGFFDYKYDIPGYAGQDFDGAGRYIYLGVSVALLFILLILLRKTKHETITKYLRILGIGMILLYLGKNTWETVNDVRHFGEFNVGILPFDTCSLIMPAALISGLAKGKVKKASDAWLATGGVAGGISNLLFLQALRYYPFFTFGALYSMIWHFLMVFTGLWLVVTNYVKCDFKTLLYAFIFHLACSAIVIPLDYAFGWDFMLYRMAGGVPGIEQLGSFFAERNLHFLTTLTMIVAYFAAFALLIYLPLGIKQLIGIIKRPKANEV